MQSAAVVCGEASSISWGFICGRRLPCVRRRVGHSVGAPEPRTSTGGPAAGCLALVGERFWPQGPGPTSGNEQ